MAYAREIVHGQPREVLIPLFARAKETDEFEFACTLLRLRGMEDVGWDPLVESHTLTDEILALVQAPLYSAFRVRLLLFLYCHVTEMRDLYNIIGNLLRVSGGERYSMAPFGSRPLGSKKKLPSPAAKLRQISTWAAPVGFSNVGEMLQEMLIHEVRNAFFHSDYTLTNSTLNIVEGDGVPIDGMIDRRVEYSWLVPRLELGVNVALAVMDLTLEHIHSYTSDKIVRGRFAADGSYVDIQLTASPEQGLTGFRSPPQQPTP